MAVRYEVIAELYQADGQWVMYCDTDMPGMAREIDVPIAVVGQPRSTVRANARREMIARRVPSAVQVAWDAAIDWSVV